MVTADPMREFRDAKEIADKLGLWCRIVDTRALERMQEVFAADVEWDFGKDTVDRSLTDVIVRIRAHLIDESECGPTQHHLANPRIDIDGDDAESEAYFFAAHAGVGAHAGRTLLQWGNYNDFWRRTAAGWRVVRRIYRITISDGPMEIVYGNGTEAMWREGDERRIVA